MKILTSAAEAVAKIESHQHVFIHSVACSPQKLIKALVERSSSLKSVHIYQIHTEFECPYAKPEYTCYFYCQPFASPD